MKSTAEKPARLVLEKGVEHALDYFCDSLDHVGARIDHFVHHRRIHSHLVGHSPGDASDQSHSGTKSLTALSAF